VQRVYGRFAVTMAHHTIDAATRTIGINRTTLIEQLHRLETDLGQQLYHRATADGQPQRPTTPGTTLLDIFAQPDIQKLAASRAFPFLDDVSEVAKTLVTVTGAACALAGVGLWLRKVPDSEG
jgi:hypothetical protein